MTILRLFHMTYSKKVNKSKELRNKKIIEVYKEMKANNEKASSRKIEKKLKEYGIKISFKTVQNVLKKNKVI